MPCLTIRLRKRNDHLEMNSNQMFRFISFLEGMDLRSFFFSFVRLFNLFLHRMSHIPPSLLVFYLIGALDRIRQLAPRGVFFSEKYEEFQMKINEFLRKLRSILVEKSSKHGQISSNIEHIHRSCRKFRPKKSTR